jgi:hypothetical protein
MTRLILRIIICLAIAGLAVYSLILRWRTAPEIPLSLFLKLHWPYAVILLVSLLLAVLLLGLALRSRKKDESAAS